MVNQDTTSNVQVRREGKIKKEKIYEKKIKNKKKRYFNA